MKSIKIYLLPLILIAFFSSPTFSQNDFYNSKKEKEQGKQKLSKTDSILVDGYFTEEDYNEIRGIKENKHTSSSEEYYKNKDYTEEERKKNERDHFLTEVAAEVIIEVVVNTLFILATFWH